MTASGETTPRWDVDDDGDGTYPELVYNGQRLWEWLCENATTAPDCLVYEGWAALVADVRAARVHEGCPHDNDTLRRARQVAGQLRAMQRAGQPVARTIWLTHLLDLLAAEGPDHE